MVDGAVCAKCIPGFLHVGEPKGTVTSIAGLPTYVAKPITARGKPGVIVIVPDVFGWEFINNRLLADAYAEKSGRTIYLPDFMNGLAPSRFVRLGFLYAVYAAGPFFLWHRASVTAPIVKSFFTILRTENPDLKIGVAGFCWGGKYALLLGQEQFSDIHLVDVVFAAHPSMVSVPKDIEAPYAPVSIAVAGNDKVFSVKMWERTQEIWEKNAEFSKFTVVVYEGAEHGFAVRGNMDNPKERERQEKAIDQAVNWFAQYLS